MTGERNRQMVRTRKETQHAQHQVVPLMHGGELVTEDRWDRDVADAVVAPVKLTHSRKRISIKPPIAIVAIAK